ncbi:cytochrome c oxidase accessory protein CcoG [Oleomonas cavernae]|uniref:Cytochrome c oxidase accessory protein CcoG n=1 Tax=Oleomonas cavernae TaxID=2320859 RepID=A0A418WFH2_9PROT|nr:cytochrome c oxidase accessory protein CcoG [Oleomonas cavernae]RJF88764.1 cytochrome c oxidase accessory protein CcoG [Oleomonas cavernae]
MASLQPAAAEPQEDSPLWFARPPVVPKKVKGPFRRIKWAVMTVLLAIYWGVPWLRFDRGPFAPDQAVLIDLPGRKAYFLWFEIWPQEIYIITGLLIVAAIGLFFVTAMLGRVWCGFACPQTVWTDLFMMVERWVEGDRAQRLRLAKAPWTVSKIAQRLAKHSLWIAIGLATGGAWILYFNDAPTVMPQLFLGTAGAGVYITIGLLTFSTYLLAGWARESVCTFMCPYARFQSAMFDRDTLVVSYRDWRGEKRGKHKAGDGWEGRGHCIDCRQCVEVCPTGIDIRGGLQMSCISCGLCVDACDGIMDKVGLPHGLIGYDTERNMALGAAGKPRQWHFIRLRTLGYFVVFAAAGAAVLWALLARSPLEASVLPDRNPLFVRLSDGDLRNGYTLKLLNKTNQPQHIIISLDGLAQGQLTVLGHEGEAAPSLELAPDTVAALRLFVRLDTDQWAGEPIDYHFNIHDAARDLTVTTPARFEGPRQ